jgi:AcrR family transcriptional regulator
MNKTITSQEAILSVGKEVVLEFGLQGLNIRDVARRCGVSVGSIYNYFPTKSDLIIATIESIWKDIMHDYKDCEAQHSFVDNIQSLFFNIQKGTINYPSFFSAHSMSVATIDKEKGRESMDKYFSHVKKGLLVTINTDSRVKSDAFSPDFTKEDFINFVFSNLITLLVEQANSCDFLLQVIRRIIYK